MVSLETIVRLSTGLGLKGAELLRFQYSMGMHSRRGRAHPFLRERSIMKKAGL